MAWTVPRLRLHGTFAQLPFVENAQEVDQIAPADDIPPMSKSKRHKNLGDSRN